MPHHLEYPEMIKDGCYIYLDRPLHLVSRVCIFYDTQPITDEILKDVEAVTRQQILDLLGDYDDLALSDAKWSHILNNSSTWGHKYYYDLTIQARVTLKAGNSVDLDIFRAKLEGSARQASKSLARIEISYFTDFDIGEVLARYGSYFVDYHSVY